MDTTLYVLVSSEQVGGPTEASLAAAGQRAGLHYVRLVVDELSFDQLQDMTFHKGDLLYRVSVRRKASAIESALTILHADALTTMYYPKRAYGPTRHYAELFEQIAAGLPVIPSVVVDDTWLRRDDAALQASIDSLGGFPVVLKVLGLSHGQGVQKHESITGLRDQIARCIQDESQVILRRYLDDYRHFRVILIDAEVVAIIEYHKPADDFRTNAQAVPDVSAVMLAEVADEVLGVATGAAKLAASVIAGVDILVDIPSGQAYLAEVNVPCNFSRAEGPTGVDIAGKLIHALQQKAAVR